MRYLAKASNRQAAAELERVLRRLEPRVAAAFRAAMKGVRDRATLRALAAALERGEIGIALELAGAEAYRAALSGSGQAPGAASVQEELLAAFREGGVAGQRQLPRTLALRASLDLTNPEAVKFVSEYLPTMIREVSEASQRAVQDAVLRGFREGRPLPTIARDVRDVVGLTSKQGRAVTNFRRQLEEGALDAGKPPLTRRLSAVERRQAHQIWAAGGEGRTKRVDALVDRYRESLVNRRAKDIARTEVHRAHLEGQEELWRQAEERGLIDPAVTRRFWVITPDTRLRDSHAAVPAMNPNGVGLHEPFDTPVGPVMAPGKSGDPGFDINCRCTVALRFDE